MAAWIDKGERLKNFYDALELYLSWHNAQATDRPNSAGSILGRLCKREVDAHNALPKPSTPSDMRAAMRFDAALLSVKYNVRRYIVETYVYQTKSKINVSERELRNAMTYITAMTFGEASVYVAA